MKRIRFNAAAFPPCDVAFYSAICVYISNQSLSVSQWLWCSFAQIRQAAWRPCISNHSREIHNSREKSQSFGSAQLYGRFLKGWADNDGVDGVLSQTVPSGDSATPCPPSPARLSWESGKMFLYFRLFYACRGVAPCNLMHQPSNTMQLLWLRQDECLLIDMCSA